MRGLDIRSLEGEEIETITLLWEKAGLPHRPRGRDSPEALKQQFLRNPDLALGAYLGDVLVGTVLATDDGRKGWINRLTVHPDHRGRGIGTSLLEHAEMALRKRGRGIIAALVEEWNDESLSFFKSRGYVPFQGISYLTKRDSSEV